MGRGWLESEDEYQGRISREANERRIEDATGDSPSQGWLESDESYHSRIADEANKATIDNLTGESPSQGWFESDSSFRERIASEAHEAVVKNVTETSPTQGWLESDEDFRHRIRHEANAATVQRESGEKPSQGWLESDSDYRARVSLEARERVAGGSGSRSGNSGGAGSSRTQHSITSTGKGGSSPLGALVAVGLIVGVAALVLSPSENEPRLTDDKRASPAAEVSNQKSLEWVAGFRDRISKRGILPIKYDEGSLENLGGEVEIFSDLSGYLTPILEKSRSNYEVFSEAGLCQNAMGPLNQSDLSEILQDKVGLLKTPANNKISQYYFSGHAKDSGGKVCYFGSLTCTDVYACLDAPTRLYLGGVNSESDDAIIGLARPLPQYFSFEDFSFVLRYCDTPRSTSRNIEVRLSQKLAGAVSSDNTLANDVLNVVLTRAANLCPIKEKRPLVPTTHPLSNITVTATDPTGNKVFELRTNDDGGW